LILPAWLRLLYARIQASFCSRLPACSTRMIRLLRCRCNPVASLAPAGALMMGPFPGGHWGNVTGECSRMIPCIRMEQGQVSNLPLLSCIQPALHSLHLRPHCLRRRYRALAVPGTYERSSVITMLATFVFFSRPMIVRVFGPAGSLTCTFWFGSPSCQPIHFHTP
jgi:hypothetical protein